MSEPTNPSGDLAPLYDVARDLGVRRADLLAAIESGDLPAARVGAQYVLSLAEVRRVLLARARAAHPTIPPPTAEEERHAAPGK